MVYGWGFVAANAAASSTKGTFLYDFGHFRLTGN